jgi:PKD repeat protein
MKKLLFIFIVILSSIAIAFGQAPAGRTCGTMEHHQYLKETRKNYSTELDQYNQMIDQYLADQAAGLPVARSSSAIITIPVVVHVVYRVAGENISDAQAASQVQVLNDDFAKLNADAIKVTQPTFSTVAAGAQIRFCLAQRDPNGNPTTGVTHNTTTVTAFGTNDAVKSNATGGVTAWDVTKYVNIWVCNLGNTLLGYGEFPTGSLSNTWGLVLHYKYTGSGGSATAPYNLGRTGTHEFGHCFNLLHIWGDDGTACSGSDQCSDTPNQAGEHYGCFTAGSIQTDACTTTSPGVMWMNYMDYTDDACMYMFTQQQVARMEAVVNNPPWNVLASSLGCTPVNALDANMFNIINPFTGSSTCNNNVTPKVTISNSGSTTLTSLKVLYKMDATATQTLNWTGSLATGASSVLTLNAYTGLSTAAHTFSVWTTAPNGGSDQYTANDSKSSTFTVIAAPAAVGLPFTEGFEAATFPPTNWALQKANTLDATVSWTRLANTTGITAGSTAIAKMDNYSSAVDIHGQIDALRSPALSFSAATTSSISMSFDVSHRPYATTNYIDTLNVYISTDCGGSWTRLYTKGGAQLSTAVGTQTTAFTPTANAQWRRETISLSTYSAQPSVYVKFESKSGYGNNLYLDNINITYTAAAAPPVAALSSPATKCTGASMTFTDQSTNSPTSWTWSFPGATPNSSTAQNPSVTYTAAGTYTVTHTAANGSGTSTPVSQTITVNASPTVAVSNATVCTGNAVTLTASGATTYSWSTSATTASISVSPTTTTVYTVTGTSAGCANTRTVNVTANTTPTVAVSNATICSGNAATLTASGATTYSWSTSATTASISVTPTSTAVYTVTGTSTGCANTKTVSVSVNTTPTVAVNNATVCTGNAVTLTASGANTYSWSTSATTASISVSPTTTTVYTVTGTSTGCTNTKTVNVTANTTPTVAVSNATICSGNAATLTASGATTYSWNTSATTASISVTPTTTTVYTVTGTTSGCTNTRTVNVTVRTTPTVAVNNATVCTGNAVTLTASGATTYSWSTSATTASISVSPTATTVYTVTGTTTGCTNTKTVSVTANTTPTVAVSNATICSGNAVTLTASGATTYSWNTSATTASISVTPTATTVYTVTGTTAGCNNVKTVSVTVKTTPTVTASNTTACSGNAVTLTAGGATTYSWSTSATTNTISVSPSSTANYTVTGTTNGCSAVKVVTVTVATTPTANAGPSQTLTCASPTVSLNGSGVTTYTWSGSGIVSGANTANPVVGSAGTYTLTGSSSGCTSLPVTVNVTSSAGLPVVASSATGSITCLVTSVNAAISTTASPVSYNWSGTGITSGASTATITVNQGGVFNYTVTNTSNGCSATGSQLVTEDTTVPTVSVNSETICSGTSTTLTASGSSATYGWDTGASGANLAVSPTADTDYTVTATGSNGCTNTAVASVVVTSAPAITVNSAAICAGSSVTLTASGVTSYTWDTSSNASSITVSPTSTTVYTVSGMISGCTTTAVSMATVTVNTPPVVSLSAISGPLCINDNTVALSGSPGGGTYSGAGVTGPVFDPAAAGAGTITITYNYTDANSCSGSDVQSVIVDLCTGITELNGSTVSVYPNPTRDALHVKLDASLIDKTVIELYDGIGKLIMKEKATGTVTSFSIAHLARGVYSIRVVSDKDHKVITIVKE